MNRNWLVMVGLVILAPCLMAPSCNNDMVGTGELGREQLYVDMKCTIDAYPLGPGLAQAGEYVAGCRLDIVEYGRDCPGPTESREYLLTVPAGTPDPIATTKQCFYVATPNPNIEAYSFTRQCVVLGVYNPGPNGPQSIDAEETGEAQGALLDSPDGCESVECDETLTQSQLDARCMNVYGLPTAYACLPSMTPVGCRPLSLTLNCPSVAPLSAWCCQ